MIMDRSYPTVLCNFTTAPEVREEAPESRPRRLIYRMMKFGTEYVDKGMAAYESKYRQHQMKWLSRQAASLNLQLIPVPEVTDEFLETASLTEPHPPSNLRLLRE